MPLNKSKKKHLENNSTTEFKIEVEYYNKDYAAFYLEQLKSLNITVEQQCDFATYIIKAKHEAKLYNPDILPFLWRKEAYYNKLINLFFESIQYNYFIKKEPNNVRKMAPQISNAKSNIISIIKDYVLAKENAYKDYKFVDQGPQLTENGLVFNKES